MFHEIKVRRQSLVLLVIADLIDIVMTFQIGAILQSQEGKKLYSIERQVANKA